MGAAFKALVGGRRFPVLYDPEIHFSFRIPTERADDIKGISLVQPPDP